MKRILLALAFLASSIASASATCTGPAIMHDFAGTAFNMSLATNAGDGNCASNHTIVGTLPAYTSIPTFKIDQTTDGTTNAVRLLAETTKVIGVVKIGDGTSTAAVKAASTAPAATDPAVVVALSPNGAQATATKQSDGTQKSQVVDGSGNVAPAGDVAARAAFQKLTDGTNTAAVKAASTASAAADPSAVTNESPNSQLSVAIGTTADAAVTTNVVGTVSAKLRGLVAILADVWDSGNHWFQVKVMNANTNGRAVSGSSSPVVPTPALTTWHLIAANSTNATSVKGSAATLFSCQFGTLAGPAWLKIYNKATAPTVGTDTPVKTLIIPVAGTAANGAGSNITFGPGGLTLGTGFAAAVTGGVTDADTTAVAAASTAINCDYE